MANLHHDCHLLYYFAHYRFYGYKQATGNLSEFMLGGRNIGPYITALSAGASDMSGWMIMGLPGSVYSTGLSAIWITIGLTLGLILIIGL